MSDEISKELVTITENEFGEKARAKEIEDPNELFIYQCAKCGNIHMRHAGYVETLLPFIRGGKDKCVAKDSVPVHICTKCKSSFIWVNEQMYNISKFIDVEAWEKSEKELNKATGPGGEC